MKVEEIISDETLQRVFEGTDFGQSTPRNVLKYACLKMASGYASGYTVNRIMINLGLRYESTNKLTQQGRKYLWAAFSENYNNE